jgi:hypothetical protein
LRIQELLKTSGCFVFRSLLSVSTTAPKFMISPSSTTARLQLLKLLICAIEQTCNYPADGGKRDAENSPMRLTEGQTSKTGELTDAPMRVGTRTQNMHPDVCEQVLNERQG